MAYAIVRIFRKLVTTAIGLDYCKHHTNPMPSISLKAFDVYHFHKMNLQIFNFTRAMNILLTKSKRKSTYMFRWAWKRLSLCISALCYTIISSITNELLCAIEYRTYQFFILVKLTNLTEAYKKIQYFFHVVVFEVTLCSGFWCSVSRC